MLAADDTGVGATDAPGPPTVMSAVLHALVAGAITGSAFGLLFGMASLNRPGANALVFYLLCAVAGAVLAVVVTGVTRAVRHLARRVSS